MIFVTLGTQDKSFTRLLKVIDKEIEKGTIKEEVIVQAGFTKYESNNMKIYDLFDKDEFDKNIKNCNYLITHGGVGSILVGLKYNKKVIACPRLAKYNEHMNDHQKQIVEKFNQEGYIIGINDVNELEEAINKVSKFKPKKYISNTNNVIKLIEDFIDNN